MTLRLDERHLLLALSGLAGIGPQGLMRIIADFHTVDAFLSSPLRKRWAREKLPTFRDHDHLVKKRLSAKVEGLLRSLKQCRGRWMTLLDDEYPPLLKEISWPPLVLFYRGRWQACRHPTVAVVGTRRPSSYGKRVARDFGAALAQAGVTIVAGLARGVDIAAHRQALERKMPTIAVLGCGLDLAYPWEHRRDFEEIPARGCLITEYVPGTPPKANHFPIRNRIISGLSLAVLVVESPRKGGTMNTAKWAVEQDRDVLAVPGPVFSANSAGPHSLIQDGAKLIHRPVDILEELNLQATLPGLEAIVITETPLPSRHEELLKLLLDGEKTLDQLCLELRTTISELQQSLLELELGGQIERLPGQRIARCR